MFDMVKIGKNIAALRRKNGMTQMAVANKLGISYQAVSNWERGCAMPDIANLKELALMFDTPIDEIIGDEAASKIIGALDNGEKPENQVSKEEFMNMAPLLEPEQNALLISKVEEPFTKEEAEDAKLNMDIDNDGNMDDLAWKLYRERQVAMFSIIMAEISDKTAGEIFKAAAHDGEVPFFAMLVGHAGADIDYDEMAKELYDKHDIAEFSIILRKISTECADTLFSRAVRDKDMAFMAVLMGARGKRRYSKSDKQEPEKKENGSDAGEKYKKACDEYARCKEIYKEKVREYKKAKADGAGRVLVELAEAQMDEAEEKMDEAEERMDEAWERFDDED